MYMILCCYVKSYINKNEMLYLMYHNGNISPINYALFK